MRQSALLQHLSLFEPKDRAWFRKWLESPFFNHRRDLCDLYAYIIGYSVKRPGLLVKEHAWEAVFPGKPYDEAKMNLLFSLLLQQVRDYLAWREWQSDAPIPRLYQLRALRKGGLDTEFERTWETVKAELDAAPYRDELYHQMCHQLYREKFDHLAGRRRVAQQPPGRMSEHRETAYQLGRLRLLCSEAVMRAVSRTAPKPPPPAFVAPENPADPCLLLYTRLLQALNTLDDAAFFEAKLLIHEHWSRFRDSERRDLYLLALNVCIRKINGGNQAFLREAFDLYREGLENRALFENGLLSRFTYKNATAAGILSGEKTWVRQFLEDYKPYLHPREQRHAYLYNLAVYYFRLPDYDAAMELLREANFGDDTLTNLDARSMLLRIYYERGELDALGSLLDSFAAYLRRSTDIGYQKANYENLLRFVRQMLRKWPLDAQAKTQLRQEVENTPALAEREWLLGQLG